MSGKDESKVTGRLKKTRLRPGYIPLTDEMLGALRREQERTGVGIHRLMAGARDAPRGLTSINVQRWFSGDIKSAHVEQYEYLLRRWQVLPDDVIIPITPEMCGELDTLLSASVLSVPALVKSLSGNPNAPDEQAIHGWRSGIRATARSAEWACLIDRLRRDR
ncbi:MAG: hypothetical protein KDE25_02820 [Novosphingobium sp.]|nr:hypothetical protein [Novosphingobium sp.]